MNLTKKNDLSSPRFILRKSSIVKILVSAALGVFSSWGDAHDYTTTIWGTANFSDGDTITAEGHSVVAGGGVIDTSTGSLTLTSSFDSALQVYNYGKFTSDGKLQATTGGSNAIEVKEFGVVSLKDVDATTTANMYASVFDVSTSGIVTVTGIADITVKGSGQQGALLYGVYVHDKDSVVSMNTVNISTSGAFSDGVMASGSGQFIDDTGTITVTTAGVWANGLYSGYDSGPGTLIRVKDVNVTTSGYNAVGLLADAGNTLTVTGQATVHTSGDASHGAELDDDESQLNLNGGTITTTGQGANGIQIGNGATKTFDDTTNDILPTITVSGAGSALVDASDTGSELLLLGNSTFDMSMTAGPGTFGAIAENGGTIVFGGNSSTGGTALWARSGGTLDLIDNVDASGSNIRLDDTSSLNLTALTGVGSLQGGMDSTVNINNATDTFIIGVKNNGDNGSMVDNANYMGHFQSNAGNIQLQKVGATTQIFSGLSNTVGSVDVQQGSLMFMQEGLFSTTDNYVTRTGATTDIGRDSSLLNVDGVFTQETGSNLHVALGAGSDITAGSAVLAGNLSVDGFSDMTTLPVKASDLTGGVYTLIHTTNGIIGNFDNNPVGASSLDYLLGGTGQLSTDGKDYNLTGFDLAWTSGGQAAGTGNFTLVAGTAFDVDIALADQVAPEGNFASGWDGKSLTKNGDGLLVLSALNTYTGGTTVNGGVLRVDVANDFDSNSNVTINGGTLDINGNDQRINQLTGGGGQIELNGATLTVNNATDADSTTYTGDITDGITTGGALTKTGDGALTLSGKTAWTGNTNLNGGALILDGSLGGAQLVSNIIAADNTTLNLQHGASLTGTTDPTDVTIDTGSTWNMTDDSQVNLLTLAGNLTFVAPSAPVMNNGRTLVAGSWRGQNGILTLNTALNGDDSVTDKLVVTGDTSGVTKVHINNVGGEGAPTADGIKVIEVQGQSDGTFTQDSRITAGLYDYNVVKQGTDWYLSDRLSPSSSPEQLIRPEAASYTENLLAANSLFILSLNDRNGDTHYMDVLGHASSLWMRNVGGHNESTMADEQNQTLANRYVMQLGGDVAQGSIHETGKYQLGVMGGYASQSSHTHNGLTGNYARGNLNGYSVGVYGTLYQDAVAENGWYADSWLQYSYFNNEVKGDDLSAETYLSRGGTASLEGGYTFTIERWESAEKMDNLLSLTPHAQAIWMGVKADDHTEIGGTTVRDKGDNNAQIRLGLRFGLDGKGKLLNETSRQFSAFVETNWIYNTQQYGVVMDDAAEHISGTRNIGELKAGVNTQVKPGLNLRIDISQQVGGHSYSDTQGTFGMKYQF